MAATIHQLKGRSWLFYADVTIGILLFAGLILSIMSQAEICTTACAEGHKYRLYGFKFEPIGFAFFGAALGVYALRWKFKPFDLLLCLMVLASLGAELKFILLQKYVIKSWCPICLSIAACVGAVAAIYGAKYFNHLSAIVDSGKRSQIMQTIRNGFGSLFVIAIGFIVAAAGITKYEPTFAESLGTETPFFGNTSSPVEIYIFTDWFCPACAKVEEKLEREFPQLTSIAKVAFIDVPVHQESYNYIPYNLSFMLKDKGQYIKLRHHLHELAQKDDTPSDTQVEDFAKPLGVNYQQLDYSQVNLGIKYFKKVSKKFGVNSTPTVVVYNTETKKAAKLKGYQEIADANFPQLIKTLE